MAEEFEDNTYGTLKRIINGEEFTRYELSDVDDLITHITYNKRKLKNSLITLTFDDDEDFFRTIGFNDSSIQFLTYEVFGGRYHYYSNEEFYNSDSAWEDWKEGYPYSIFNNENKEKFRKIVLLSLGEKMDENVDNRSLYGNIYNLFQRKIDNIIEDYQYKMNECYRETAQKEITEEIGSPLESDAIMEVTKFKKYITTVGILVSLYEKVGETNLSLRELITKLMGGKFDYDLYDYKYEYGCRDLDEEDFNETVRKSLEDIEEKITEDYDEEYLNMVSLLLKDYSIQTWYVLKRLPDAKFMITELDPERKKIKIIYIKPNGDRENRSYTITEFFDFIHSPELFERKILKFKKKL